MMALLWAALKQLGSRSPRQPVWGDGYESDGIDHFARVADWDAVSNDELIRVFPRLLGVPSPRLIGHMERCLAALFRLESGAGGKLVSMSAERIHALGSVRGAEWAPAPTKSYCDSLLAGDISILDDVLLQLHEQKAPVFEPQIAEVVAFHTGIHPAYFWAEALALHERLTSFGWLGFVMRGRRALMPLDVAEYLYAFGANPKGDERFSRRLGSARMTASLLRQAAERLSGREVVATGSAAGLGWTSSQWCMT